MKARRGLLHAESPRALTQRLAVDDFREIPERKKRAEAMAQMRGHVLSAWHRRPNDPYGRHNSFCRCCQRIAVVAAEPPDQLADSVYGHALTQPCVKVN